MTQEQQRTFVQFYVEATAELGGEAWALVEAIKQFGPTARVWTVKEVFGRPTQKTRFRIGFLDDGVTPRYVEIVDGVRLRMKGVGGSWGDAVASGLTTTPTSHLKVEGERAGRP